MAKINLLPWREELRKKNQQNFLMALGGGVVVTCLLFGLVYLHIEGLKEYQGRRNQRLNDEIKKVDKKIKEIKEIEDKKSKLREKITLIENLQGSRPEIVHLFDDLRKTTPVGVYLTSFQQKGKKLIIQGKAQSHSRISEYMNTIEASEWVESPKLQVIKGQGNAAKEIWSTFTMNAKQAEINAEDDEE